MLSSAEGMAKEKDCQIFLRDKIDVLAGESAVWRLLVEPDHATRKSSRQRGGCLEDMNI